MGVPPVVEASAEPETAGSWRDELSLRVAKASVLLYGLATLLTATVHGGWQRLVLAALALSACFLVAIPAFTGRPKGKLRAWFVIVPPMVASVAGFGIVGFLAGPAVLLTVTVMLGGLLLGRRSMAALFAVSIAGIGATGWAMVQGVVPLPGAQNVSMAVGTNWFRTVAVMSLAIGLMGTPLVGVVKRIERLLEQAKQETQLRQQAEQARAHAELMAMANKQLETIGRLAAGIAHDFNNNLAAVIGSAELMREELRENRISAELLDDILASSRRAAELTRQLLVYSRKAPMVLLPTDIHQLVENTVILLRRSSDPKILVVTRLLAEDAIILADASLFDNALLNLLVNARDAMPAGGKITVATSSYRVAEASLRLEQGLPPGEYVLIEVLDTGDGIPAEALPNIFEPFFTTKPIGKGTGLGLAAVAGAIKSLKGAIDVESEPGCGTAVRILLPCHAGDDLPEIGEVAQLARGSGHVLLVDDDPSVRRTAAATLRNLGYDVTITADGMDALDVLRNSPAQFQLVILDLCMPRMDGLTTHAAIRQLAPSLPVLVWSGYGSELDVESMLRNGAVGFIQKPYAIVELSHAVYEAIHGRSVGASHERLETQAMTV